MKVACTRVQPAFLCTFLYLMVSTIRYGDREVSGHSLLDVLSLCVPKGDEIHIEIAQDERGGCGTISIDEVERGIKELFDVVFM